MIKTDWIIGIYTYRRGTKNIDMNIPQGNSREEVKMTVGLQKSTGDKFNTALHPYKQKATPKSG